MTLEECTKDELIYVIARLRRRSSSGYIRDILLEVEQKREEKDFAEAARVAEHAFEKDLEFTDLMGPYVEGRFVDIPRSVLDEARAVMKEAEEAERKWKELMGIVPTW